MKHKLRKGLAVAVILLFIEVSVIPSTGAFVDTDIDYNNPPSAPIFLGPTRGVVGEHYRYTINSTDPDGDDVYYRVMWELNVLYEWIGPFPSGEEINIGHTWDERGTYYVLSQAKDVHNATSDFTVLEVIIGETIYVDDDNTEGPWNGTIEYPYQYIQDGINNAFRYNTVFVYNGTYYENVIVYKSINLIGENRETTIIEGNRSVYLSVDWVNISGFTIQCGIDLDSYGNNNTISGNTLGRIGLENSYNNIISNNIICNRSYWKSIDLSYSCNNIITDNKILDSVHGIGLSYSSNNIITGNNIISNAIGIDIHSSNNNIITGNNISKFIGITLAESNSNNITGNNIISNLMGIWLIFSIKNIIEKNNFIGNIRHAYFHLVRKFWIGNHWDSNYWNKWIGIGPKIIFGRLGLYEMIPWVNFDWHPAQEPYDMGV